MTTTRNTATASPHPGRTAPGRDRPGDTGCSGHPRKAIFGPNTPRVLQFLINLRNLPPAAIDVVSRAWNEGNSLDRARAWAHLATVTQEEYPVTAAASAARRAAMDTACIAGRNEWAFWAAARDAAAAVTADDLAESDYQALTHPLSTVMPALNGSRQH